MFLDVSRAQQRNHFSQKIAKDTKTNLGPKGPRLDNLSTGPALGWFSKMGISTASLFLTESAGSLSSLRITLDYEK